MKLMILDGNSIINRAFFGIRSLSAPDGTPTNAIYGFITIFERLYADIAPDAVAVAFDKHGPTFRHKAVDTYKAGRKPMPEDLVVQMPIMKKVLEQMNIRYYEIDGYEADDILGTAASICTEKGWECVVVTGDKDSLQLVSDNVTVCIIKTRMGQTETIMYTPERFREEYGFESAAMVDLKSLMGDSSDNISGVAGIGEKTAMELLQKYGTIDKIYEDVDALDVKDSVKKKLTAGKDSAYSSYWLATIFREVPISFDPEENLWSENYLPGLYDVFRHLGFNKLISKLKLTAAPAAAKTKAKPDEKAAAEEITVYQDNCERCLAEIRDAEYVAVISDDAGRVSVYNGRMIYNFERMNCPFCYDEAYASIFGGKVKKLGHNVKALMRRLSYECVEYGGFIFDTALAAYLISSTDENYTLSRLSEKYLGRECAPAEAIYELYPVLTSELEKLGLDKLYYSAEMPLCEVLADMEDTGFLVDRDALHDFGESLSRDIDALQSAIYDSAGYEFNINSPKQLGELLFDKLMLPNGKKTKTGWSTNADVLEKLRGFHPIIDDILEYRMLTKLKSTYTDGLQKVIADDGRIHTNFQMTVTATGRLSSTEPNLQNIPIRKQLGSRIRKMFIASPGNVLVDADYSQIELRLLAHISDDQNMIAAFLSGEDFHTVTASNVFNVPVDEVTSTLRSRAKAVNFGMVYGISAYSLSQDIGVSTREAKAYMDAYFDEYSGVAAYMDKIIKDAKEQGYVSTLYGRRRDLPELKSPNHNVRSFGERIALNMPVQGTAADIIKLAMVDVYNTLKAEGLKAKLVLQVHDELIVECPEDECERVKAILKNSMENIASLAVPLTVEVNSGKDWAEAH